MANFSLFQAINMGQIYAWDGDIPIATESQIRVTDGYRVQDYFGSFSYNDYGLSGGYVTSANAYENGIIQFSVSGFNANAILVESYIDDGDITGALSYILSGNDNVYGSAGDDVILGFVGNDNLYGGEGNDTFIGESGNDFIEGGNGLDVINYSGNSSSYSVLWNGGSYLVNNGLGQTDTILNIERLSFANDGAVIALDVQAGQDAGSAYRLYQAAFNREPDGSGLSYWIAQMDAGKTVQDVARFFVDSAEFRSLNPGLDSDSIINSIYGNVLHRMPDQGGFDYWSQQMDNGMSAGDLLANFSESNENVQNTAAAIQDGIWLIA